MLREVVVFHIIDLLPRAPLGGWPAFSGWIGVRRICRLSRRTGVPRVPHHLPGPSNSPLMLRWSLPLRLRACHFLISLSCHRSWNLNPKTTARRGQPRDSNGIHKSAAETIFLKNDFSMHESTNLSQNIHLRFRTDLNSRWPYVASAELHQDCIYRRSDFTPSFQNTNLVKESQSSTQLVCALVRGLGAMIPTFY